MSVNIYIPGQKKPNVMDAVGDISRDVGAAGGLLDQLTAKPSKANPLTPESQAETATDDDTTPMQSGVGKTLAESMTRRFKTLPKEIA